MLCYAFYISSTISREVDFSSVYSMNRQQYVINYVKNLSLSDIEKEKYNISITWEKLSQLTMHKLS